MNQFDLSRKVAIVTGANKGLGKGMALALASAGADIVGVSIENLDEVKSEVENLGRKFLAIEANLSTTDVVQEIIEKTLNEFGKIDILVNNAGMIIREEALDYSMESFDSVMNLNLRTLFYLSQQVAKQYVKQKTGGKIINIASMLSFQGGIRVPAYTASKSAVMGLTKALANEWAKYNINAIAPGYMSTDNTKAIRADEKRSSEILDRIPAGRWGTPDDLAGAAIFLASDASNYVNGHTLAVDGGWLAR